MPLRVVCGVWPTNARTARSASADRWNRQKLTGHQARCHRGSGSKQAVATFLRDSTARTSRAKEQERHTNHGNRLLYTSKKNIVLFVHTLLQTKTILICMGDLLVHLANK
jgi:hypothetical protein